MSTPPVNICYFSYDIPDDSGVANPSGILHGLGFRDQGSCWIIPEPDVPRGLTARMREKGCRVSIIRFDPAEYAAIIEKCIEALQNECRNIFASARVRALAAIERMESPLTAGGNARSKAAQAKATYPARVKTFRATMRTILRESDRDLADIVCVSSRFFVDSPALSASLRLATAACRTLRAEMEKKLRQYLDTLQAIADLERQATGKSTPGPMARAFGSREGVPGYVVADWQEEHGGNGQATREAFGWQW